MLTSNVRARLYRSCGVIIKWADIREGCAVPPDDIAIDLGGLRRDGHGLQICVHVQAPHLTRRERWIANVIQHVQLQVDGRHQRCIVKYDTPCQLKRLALEMPRSTIDSKPAYDCGIVFSRPLELH